MDYGNLIREVVKTYELPQRLEARIVRIAERRIAEQHLNTASDVYSYVDYLAERFTRSRQDRLTVSLDAKLKHDSKTTFLDTIGAQDPNLLALQAPPPQIVMVPEFLKFLICCEVN